MHSPDSPPIVSPTVSPTMSPTASSPCICFLLDTRAQPHNDNHLRLPRAFASLGWGVVKADQWALGLAGGKASLLAPRPATALDTFDLVWHLGLGDQASFLDRMELLSTLPQGRMVTPASALALRHGKLHLGTPPLGHLLPETHASRHVDDLLPHLRDKQWVIKPSAASFGRGFSRISASTPNLRETLRSAAAGGFLVLQRHLVTDAPETRVIYAEGEPVGHYGREPSLDGPSNLFRGGVAIAQDINAKLAGPIEEVGRWLARESIGFAAADFRAGHLIEINIANPGGLATLQDLTGEDAAMRVATLLARRL